MASQILGQGVGAVQTYQEEEVMVRIQGDTVVGRSMEDVFDFVADERNEPAYNRRMVVAEKLTSGPIGTGTSWKATVESRGRPLDLSILITDYDRPRRLASVTAMSKVDVSGAVTLEETPEGTRLRWSWEVRPKGFLKLLTPLIAQVGRRQEAALWESLKEYLESRRDGVGADGRELAPSRPESGNKEPEQHRPLPAGSAWLAVARCCAVSLVLLARGRVHLPRARVGRSIGFADGSYARVFRETSIGRPPPADACVLVVAFRLRGVQGRGHALFERESLLNTVLFAGFPGLISKLWLAHDGGGRYRGLYEWDGPASAEAYARALWRVLALVSVAGSIDYQVIPGVGRDDLLADPGRSSGPNRSGAAWAQVTGWA